MARFILMALLLCTSQVEGLDGEGRMCKGKSECSSDADAQSAAGMLQVYSLPGSSSSMDTVYNPASVAEAWQNHADAFGSNDLDKIMLDYTEKSIVELYNQGTGSRSVYEGTAQIRGLFDGLFGSLGSPNPFTLLADPVVEEKSEAMQFGHVFLLWEAASRGFARVTDTFVFGESFKIIRQTVVVFPEDGVCPTQTNNRSTITAASTSPVQLAWDNHFAAFAGQNVTSILLDYTADSKVFDSDVSGSNSSQILSSFATQTEIGPYFGTLFANLAILSDLSIPVVHTYTFGLDGDTAGDALGMTFLIWRSPADRYAYATDTFVYNQAGVILRQNVVALIKDPCV